MLCPVDHDFAIQGHKGSEFFEYAELKVDKCTNNSNENACYP